jgi:hypothetical protein
MDIFGQYEDNLDIEWLIDCCLMPKECDLSYIMVSSKYDNEDY